MDTKLEFCRICKSNKLTDVIDLGDQIITSRFPKVGEYVPSSRVCLCQCDNCKLVQLKYTVKSSEMYEHLYGYRSGINYTMREHLRLYNQQLQNMVIYNKDDFVLDIGSNDATFLKNYPDSLYRLGIDPTGKQYKEYYENINLIPDYFTKENIYKFLGEVKFKTISSISMFYDLPDPVQFARDIYDVLDDEGVWTLEQSYLGTMIERNSIDTICHEHLEYYGLKQIKHIMDLANLKILDVSFNNCNGGSFRIFVSKKESKFIENISLVNDILMKEEKLGLDKTETYTKFMENCDIQILRLNNFIKTINDEGKKIYIYGASTKGNCLLQYANIGLDKISYAVERNPLKFGLTTSTKIPIISEEEMRSNPPDYQLVLPWHFKDEIIDREKDFLNNGGKFIFPFPEFEIFTSKPKLLITGIHGQIAHYVIQKFKNTHQIYGISRKSSKININNTDIFYFDLKDTKTLELTILSIKPDIIIHLAGMSNFDECTNNIVESIEINGMVMVNIADIIHKNQLNTKVFNASSCVNYKGHINYKIEENDTNLFPNSVYGIGKSLSQYIVDYYRSTYGYHFSNGILFTTESDRRNTNFLFKKVSNHAKEWRSNKTPLTVSSLDSYRNILHAEDVAEAIYIILNHLNGDNYLICSPNVWKVSDLVLKIYQIHGINLTYKDGNYYEDDTLVINIKESIRTISTMIDGNCKKLYELGWNPDWNIDNLLEKISK